MTNQKQRNDELVSSDKSLCQRQLSADERAGDERQQADEFARQRNRLWGNDLPDAIGPNSPALPRKATDSGRDEIDAEWEQDAGQPVCEAVHVWQRTCHTLDDAAAAEWSDSTELSQADHVQQFPAMDQRRRRRDKQGFNACTGRRLTAPVIHSG